MSESQSPLERALVAMRDLRGRVERMESRRTEPLAILGMSCRLPGGVVSPEGFWTLLDAGVDATGEVPADRWDMDALYHPDPAVPGRLHVRRGGFLQDPIDRFDAAFFGISPREAEYMDPAQRLLLELAWEALERSGIPPRSLEGSRTGVFLGLADTGFATRGARRTSLRRITGYTGTGTLVSVGSGRVSYVLGLRGPNLAVDTACSSSLVAMVLGMESIREGRSDLALVGGLNLILSPDGSIFMSKVGALSADGRCRTFDASASGYARAEGGGVFVLKRLGAALADGDPIVGVLRGGAINHDGRSSGLTVPSAAAQHALIEAALENAGLSPLEIDYAEAHGTGTPLGDPIELRVLGQTYGRGRRPDDPLQVGSVKTNIGHPETGAGAAGVGKVLLAMEHGRVPPHLHLEEPTPHVDWSQMALRVSAEGTAWPDRDHPRRASVSAFGLSGTNAHVILEAAPEPGPAAPVTDPRPRHLVAVSGATESSVATLASAYARALEAGEVSLADLEATTLTGRSPLAWRSTVHGTTPAEIVQALGSVARGERRPARAPVDPDPRIAFLFTGQGSQYPGMAAELLETSPVFRAALERCDAVLAPLLGESILDILRDPEADRIHRTGLTQPLLFAVEWGLARMWSAWGVEPDVVLGHSLGEFVAATVAGVFELEAALRLVATRGALMEALPEGGAMAVLYAPESVVARALAGREAEVGIAAVNGPDNVVISGAAAVVAEIVETLRADDVASTPLTVSHAFHSPLMDSILEPFRAAVVEAAPRDPEIPLLSNVTGRALEPGMASDPDHWVRHVRSAVRFHDSVRSLVDDGVERFVEMGPHPSLSGMTRAAFPDRALTLVPTLRRNREAWSQLLDGVGMAYEAGLPVDWKAFVAGTGGRRAVLPTYPFERESYWLEEEPGGVVAGSLRSPVAHPYLGTPLSSPAIRGWVFENRLDRQTPAYVVDHKVDDQPVYPGTGYIELFLAAARFGPGWDGAGLEHVTYERMLTVPEGEGGAIQVIVNRPREGRADARIAASFGESGEWFTVASATLVEAPDRDALEDRERPTGVDQQLDIARILASNKAAGLDYGPAFRGLTSGVIENGRAVGIVELPEVVAHDAPDVFVHPCLLDPATQLVGALAAAVAGTWDGDAPADDVTLLPFAVESCWFRGPVGGVVEVRAQLRATELGPRDDYLADYELYEPGGERVGVVRGHHVRWRPKQRLQQRTGPVGQALSWVPLSGVVTVEPAAGPWILVDDGSGLAEGVAGRIEAAGGEVTRASAAGLSDALDAVDAPLVGLVCLATAGDEELSLHLANLGEAIRREVFAPGADLVFVTRGAAGPGGAQSLSSLTGAGLHGTIAVLRAEHPEIRARAVDLDPVGEPAGMDPVPRIFHGSPDPRVAVRENQVWAPRLEHLDDAVTLGGIPAGMAAPNYRLSLGQRGTLDAIAYEPSRRVAPRADEVEVRVEATGLNFRDVLNVLGQYPGDPGDPGVEFAGVVERVGSGVRDLTPGTPVIGVATGLFTRYANVPAHVVVPQPQGLDFDRAASVPVTFLTAEWGLRELGRLAPGERVLIHAAAGGVGSAAIQVAQAVGAEVFATASAPKRAFVRAQGVEHVFDSRSASFHADVLAATGGEGVDVVLNSLTGELLERSIDLLRDGGRFVEMGRMQVFDPQEFAREHPGREYHLVDFSALPNSPEVIGSVLGSITHHFDRGAYHALRTRVFPPESVREAFRFMAQARHLGKLVVRSAPTRPGELVQDDGVYVVTGATGGIGVGLVRWLAGRGAGAVVATSRSEPAGEAADAFEELRAAGCDVRWVGADVGLRADVERVLDEARATGRHLRGVFHGAGVLDDRMWTDVDGDSARRVVGPKVDGALHLHALTRDDELHHFVLFSSAASLLGGPGQGTYGAANAALGALAEARHRAGLPALCIDWGAWDRAGMAARLDAGQRRVLESRGLRFLDPDDAFGRMERLLGGGTVRALVADWDWNLLSESMGAGVPGLLDEVAVETSVAAGVDLEALLALDPDARRQEVAAWLLQSISGVLGLKEDQVDGETLVATLGFDSLMAVELRNRIQKEFEVAIPAPRLLGCRTVDDLVSLVDLSLGVSAVQGAGDDGDAVEVIEV